MKKLIVVKMIITIILVLACGFLYYKYDEAKGKNEILKLDIKKVKTSIEVDKKDIEITTKNVEKLKEEKKDSLWELDSWKLMKEKIEKAL